MKYLLFSVLIGAGATATMDVWGVLRKPLLGVAPPDYGLVGRWLAHVFRGRFRHDSIARAAPVRGERLLGWTAHYLTGIVFASILVVTFGLSWVEHPTPGPALAVGLGTLLAPFLIMQPGMGAGIAASRTPKPNAARFQSILTHLVFGFGLYAAGWVLYMLLVEMPAL